MTKGSLALKLSVCIIAPAMPPIIGGAETFAEVIILTLLKSGIEVHVLTSENPRLEVRKKIKETGGSIKIHGSEFGAKDGYVAWEWATFSRAEVIYNLVETRRIDIIHALSHDTVLDTCMALEGYPEYKRPKVVATTSEMSTEDSKFGIARSKFIYKLPIDGLLQLSQYYLNIAMKHGCKPQSTSIASAVDTELFSSGSRIKGRDILNINQDCFLITCPSRFSPRKGQHDLLSALKLLPYQLQNRIVCLLAGSTNSASSEYLLKIKKQSEGLPCKCIITGVSRANMPDVLTSSDLVVIPSRKEGLGFAAIESMVAGCPVLLNKVSGFDEIPSKPGQVSYTTAGDVSELAQKLQILITDNKHRLAIAKAGQRLAKQKFSPQNLSSKTLQLYRNLIKINT